MRSARARADARCIEIADRAAGWAGLPDDAVAIEVVTERHDVVAQVSGAASLLDRTVYARCEIEPTMTVAPAVEQQAAPPELWRIVDAQAPPERLAMLRILTGVFAVGVPDDQAAGVRATRRA